MTVKINITAETYSRILKEYELDIQRALEIYESATEEEIVFSTWRCLVKTPDSFPAVLEIARAVRKIGPPDGKKNTEYFDLIGKTSGCDPTSPRRYASRWGLKGVFIAHRERAAKETHITPPSEQAKFDYNGNGQTEHRRPNLGRASVNDILRVTLSNELRFFINEHKNVFAPDAIATLELFHSWLNEHS